MTAPPLTPAAFSTPTATRFRVDGLDGLRAVAVATVVVFHLFPGVLPGGFLGVDVFFVISGFLITALLLRERRDTGRVGLADFWARRARRLLPALGALLAVTTAAALAVGGDALVRIGWQLLGAVTFSGNWVLMAVGGSYFAETTPELYRNLWSLAVEEQFYLVWPLLFLLLVRAARWVRVAVAGAGFAASAIAMALLWDPAAPTLVYYGTGTHAFGLALGALLALLAEQWPEQRLGWPRRAPHVLVAAAALSLAALVAAAALVPEDSPWVFLGGLPAVAALTAVVIAGLLVPGSWLGRALAIAPLTWIGRRSYGIYLWHWPVLVLLVTAFPQWPRAGLASIPLGAVALALTLTAAALSYRLLEDPIRRHGFRATLVRWFGLARRRPGVPARGRWARRLVALPAALTLVAGAGTAATLAIARDPGRGDAEIAIQAGLDALERFEDQAPRAPDAAPGPTADAPAAEPAAGDQISAVGDSVMLAAAPELRARFPGIAIDAAVSRSMSTAPGILRSLRDQGQLRPVVVVALGTNGPVSADDLTEIRDIIGPERALVVVNAQAPRSWIPGVNDKLSRFAQAYREVELANWHDAIQPSLDVLAGDQVHFGDAGARIFVRSVADALQRLAELPPLRDDRADLAYPRPG